MTDINKVKFSSDWHLFDQKMVKSLGFATAEEHADWVIDNANSQLGEDDMLYLVGDIICGLGALPYLRKLNTSNIIFILGNWDTKTKGLFKELPKYVTHIAAYAKLNNYLITHMPVHSSEALNYTGVIHGHLHHDVIHSSNYFNINLHIKKNALVPFTDILNR